MNTTDKTWSDALAEALKELIKERNLKVTEVSERANYQKNFLSKVFSGKESAGKKRSISAI